ncbi:MAG: sulfurtransferase TusA family protein [Gemmatimonadota bacterium]
MNDVSVVRLDMSGLSCPLPLLGAKKILDDLPDGHRMVLISDCPGTGDDLGAWADQTGHQVVATERLNGRRVAYTIRRGRTAGPGGGNVVLDLRGATCPGPIAEAHRLLSGMQRGEVLVLISNCPGVTEDVAAWAGNGGVRLLDQYESAPGEFEFYLRKE